MNNPPSNPLSHVGQTPHPEVSEQTQRQCEQAQAPAPSDTPAAAPPLPAEPAEPAEPAATRLPQHPRLKGDDTQPISDAKPEPGAPQGGPDSDADDAALRHDSAV